MTQAVARLLKVIAVSAAIALGVYSLTVHDARYQNVYHEKD